MASGSRGPTNDVDDHPATGGSLSAWKLDAKTQTCPGPDADAMHRQHRELPLEAAKNAGFKPENESKNPDKSGKIRKNPGESG